MGAAKTAAKALPPEDPRLAEAFPDVPCGHRPFGQYVIVQIRRSKDRTSGGILLSAFDKDTERDNTQVGRVVAIGPGCFRDRRTGEEWPEGAWFAVGDHVRSPKYGGDRWTVPYERTLPAEERGNIVIPKRTERGDVEFAMFKDLDLRCRVDDPMSVKAYV